jgi:aldose 1-epimerase
VSEPTERATAPGDAPLQRVSIAGGQLSATFVSRGASLVDLRLSDHSAPLVLGVANPDDPDAHGHFLGAVCGRFANRIAGGRFAIDGERFRSDLNDSGRHTLHGGGEGSWARRWETTGHGSDHVRFRLEDEDGAMGFPGNLQVTVTWRIGAPATLTAEIEAVTDRPTPCSFALHPYFNLDDGGRSAIGRHRLVIEAPAYLPVDDEGIPTGEVRPVGGAFDFRTPRPMGAQGGEGPARYDHNYCLSAARGPMRRAAWAQGALSGIEMEVWTTEPGLQFYTGQHLPAGLAGLDGRAYGPGSGFCLEPQAWPDAPNHGHFPIAVLRPGETYRQVTQYRFRLPG